MLVIGFNGDPLIKIQIAIIGITVDQINLSSGGLVGVSSASLEI